MTTTDPHATLRAGSRRFNYPNLPAHPPTLELSLQTARHHHMNSDEARLLPRWRYAPSLLEQRRRERQQATALLHALAADPHQPLPPRHALTKPGDPDQLRGIPAIGRSVTGAIRNTSPEAAALRRITRAEQLAEKTREAEAA